MIKNAYIDELTLITIPFSEVDSELFDFTLINTSTNEIIPIKKFEKATDRWRYELSLLEPIKLGYQYEVGTNDGTSFQVKIGQVVRTRHFDTLYFYDCDDLGVTYRKNSTVFKLWAPTATEVQLILRDETDVEEMIPLKRREYGVWEVEVAKDTDGSLYYYRIFIDNCWREAVDPYAKAVTVNGEQGVVVNLSTTNPLDWHEVRPPFAQITDAIIYELHVRDFSIDKNSGINNKGKFIGLTETGTKGPWDTLTGLDYLSDLGITHVQLLPIQDFGSVDETNSLDTYNWGYDTVHFNAIEGSYSLNPFDPKERIKELKKVVQTYHNNGIRVIFDVVYNHVYIHETSPLEKVVPGYFFRYHPDGKLADGTGVGNDIASERKMVRKFIVDSVVYFAKEFHVDGFRFDLMGNLDIDTMVEIRQKLTEIDSSILILGEGWDLATPLANDKKAIIGNSDKLKGISHFNDQFRDKLKGNIFDKKVRGFCNGEGFFKDEFKSLVSGSTKGFYPQQGLFSDPYKSVNYVECHDNHTLWDRLTFTNSDDSESIRAKMHQLATSITILSQGIPFLHAGQEFYRTKSGVENSYNCSDEINKLDWKRKALQMDYVDYVKGLIAIRKKYDVFRLSSKDLVKKHMHILDSPPNCLAYMLRDNCGMFVVAFNGAKVEKELILPSRGKWGQLVGDGEAKNEPFYFFEGNKINLAPISTIVLYHGKDYERS